MQLRMESRTSGRPRVSIGSEPQAGVRATRQLVQRVAVEHELKTVLEPIKEQVRSRDRGARRGERALNSDVVYVVRGVWRGVRVH